MGFRFTASLLTLLVLAVVVGLAAGNSRRSNAAAPSPPTVPAPQTTPLPGDVYISSNASDTQPAKYTPPVVTIHKGQYVLWGNGTSESHTVTADGGAFNSGPVGSHEIFKWKPRKAGTYPYSCFIHPEMHGVVVVLP